MPSVTDYALARRAVLRDFRSGALTRLDVCDAHPELLRAARNAAISQPEECPICEDETLVHVSYVFGSRLPAHGRCVTSQAELAKLHRRPTVLACYVVEVCPACSWNHLARSFPVGGRGRASKT